MKKLKIGIIGCGNIANGAHLPGYLKADNIEVVATCDIVEEKAKKIAQVLSLDESRVFTDYNDVLALDDIDAVDICTPNYLHSVIAVAALERGIHVFCEKPDAVSVAEAEKMKVAAEKSGKVLMVMRNNRFYNRSKFLKQFIEDGKMGEIYTARCAWRRRRGIPGKGGWFTTKEQSGGGPLIDLGVHMIDLAIWLMGNPTPVAVTGCTYRKFADSDVSDSVHSSFGEKKADGVFDVEDLAMGFIRFDNGASMQIEFSWASNIQKEIRFCELRGDKAGAYWSEDSLKIFGEEYEATYDINVNAPDGDLPQHAQNILHFADVVLNGAKPGFEPIQGLNMVKILEALYRSAEEGKEIKL